MIDLLCLISRNKLNNRGQSCMTFTFTDFSFGFSQENRSKIWEFCKEFIDAHKHIYVFGSARAFSQLIFGICFQK